MHKVWLIAKREFIERVKTKAFIIFTVLVPLLFGGIGPLFGKLMTMKSGKSQNLVLVTGNSEFAEAFKKALAVEDKRLGTIHALDVDRDTSSAHLSELTG